MSLTESSTVSEPTSPELPPTDLLTPNQELQRAARLREGLKRTLMMCVIDSFDESLEWELDAIKKQNEIDFGMTGGSAVPSTTPTTASAEGDEAVKQFVAGDLKIEKHVHYEGAAKPEPATEPTKTEPTTPPTPVTEKPPTTTPPDTTTPTITDTTVKKKSRWPWAAALGLGVPATVGLLMAPSIIAASKTPPSTPPAVHQTNPEYQPILLPGKPAGAK